MAERPTYRTAPGGRPAHVALIGMMAAGKSTVGRALAERRGIDFVDTDALIEEETGRTVQELWDAGGEAAYRPLERRAVITALARPDPLVLATPGGVAVDPLMADALSADHVTTVLLRATPETLASRVGGQDHRPLLGDDPAAAIADLARERAGRYAAMADLVVDVDGRDGDDLAAEIDAWLGGRPAEDAPG